MTNKKLLRRITIHLISIRNIIEKRLLFLNDLNNKRMIKERKLCKKSI